MADEYDYEKLLERARSAMPEDVAQSDERWSLPELDLMFEGRTTVLKNYQEVVGAMRRDSEHIIAHVLRELGTAGSVSGRRLILKSVVTKEKLEEKFEDYVNTFVICGECGKPDTHLVKEGRTQVIECMACGAKRPVKVKKGMKTKDKKNILEVGVEVEVLIQDVGKMGDGVAKIDRYTIFVPGVAKGAKVKIRVEKVSGYIVVGRVVS
ncbi:MAG: translation initiation factor IF-2 subunit beta [Thermoplasmatota archaeon]